MHMEWRTQHLQTAFDGTGIFACSTLRLDPHAPVYISRVHIVTYVVDEDGDLLGIQVTLPCAGVRSIGSRLSAGLTYATPSTV